MHKLITFLLLLIVSTANSQITKNELVGKFADDITELTLNSDSTFELKTPDYIFPYTFTVYQNRGNWTRLGNMVILNPNKAKRLPKLQLTEKTIEGVDSVEIKIRYLTEIYENEILVSTSSANFDLLTLYLNKPTNYQNLVHSPIRRVCSFSPRVKKQTVVDSFNVVRFKRQKVEKVGIYSYGFEKPVELFTKNPNANYFEIIVIQPIDIERMPRTKQVIIKNKYAYFYEVGGKIPTSGIFLSGLKRVN